MVVGRSHSSSSFSIAHIQLAGSGLRYVAGIDDSSGAVLGSSEDHHDFGGGGSTKNISNGIGLCDTYQHYRTRTGLRNTGIQTIVGRTVCVYCGAMFGEWACGKTGHVAAAHKSHELAKAVRCPFVY